MPVLIVQTLGQQSYRLPLEDAAVRVGRSQKNQICLSEDASASRYHAEISTDRNGAWFVSDLGSHNGTFVDDQPVTTKMRLESGSRIRVGRTTVMFTEGSDTAERQKTGPMPRVIDETSSVVVPVSEILSSTVLPLTPAAAQGEPAHGRAFRALSRAADVLLDHRPLDDVLQVTLDMVFEAVGPERGAILLLEGEGDDASLVMRASRGIDVSQDVISNTIADMVVHKEQSVLTSNAQVDPRFMEAESIAFQSVHSALAVPLWNNKTVTGLVYTDSTRRPQAFTKTDLEAVTLLANFAAVKIDNVRLFERDQQMRVLEAELQNAARIQKRLLPDAPPRLPGWEIFGFNAPCHDVGGDYYDFVKRPGGRLGLALGDVAGKGLAAALLMATCQAAFRAHASTGEPPVTIVTRLNTAIVENSDIDKFVTFFYGDLDPATGRLEFVNAGHNPPMLFRHGGGVEELQAGGPILGFRKEVTYRLQDVTLAPGDVLVTFSDGVTESQDLAREEFGEERLAEVVTACRDRPVAEIWDAVNGAVKRFVGGAAQFDDLTLTIVKRTAV